MSTILPCLAPFDCHSTTFTTAELPTAELDEEAPVVLELEVAVAVAVGCLYPCGKKTIEVPPNFLVAAGNSMLSLASFKLWQLLLKLVVHVESSVCKTVIIPPPELQPAPTPQKSKFKTIADLQFFPTNQNAKTVDQWTKQAKQAPSKTLKQPSKRTNQDKAIRPANCQTRTGKTSNGKYKQTINGLWQRNNRFSWY